MGKGFVFWSAQEGAGRRSLVHRLAARYSESKLTTIVVELRADGEMRPNVESWLPHYKGLSAEMTRRLFSVPHKSYAVEIERGLPSAPLTREWIQHLLIAFDRVLLLAPGIASREQAEVLDHAKGLISVVSSNLAAEPVLHKQLEALASMHIPHALLRPLLNRVPHDTLRRGRYPKHLAGRPILCALAEDEGNGLRWKENVEQLFNSLESGLELVSGQRDTSVHESRHAIEALKSRVQPELLKALPLGQVFAGNTSLDAAETQKTVEACLAREEELPASREMRSEMVTRVLDEVLGLGALEPLLKDETVSEIMINGSGRVYVERQGVLEPSTQTFQSNLQLRTIIDRIVAPLGRRVDESMPLCDARLADGSRVNIVLPPLALDGPLVTIRKFATRALLMNDLVEVGSMSLEMAAYLAEAVRGRRNIVVSGGTGSGKTTLLNALSSLIPDEERIVTIEDAAELRLQKPHVVRLESRPPNAEGQGEIPIRRLVINALRMRPDRIVVGECRGGEALDMLQAMNTGHDGSMTTLHANSPRDALGRLETLVMMAGMDLPLRVVREQIRSAVHLVLQQARVSGGQRKVVSITEVLGIEGETLITRELFSWRNGVFTAGNLSGSEWGLAG